MRLLGFDVQEGDRVKFLVKPIKKLLDEGWCPDDNGNIKRVGAFYKFTSKKRPGCIGQGKVAVNPNGKACVRADKTGWGYDESMLEAIVPLEKNPYKPFEMDIDMGRIVGENHGELYIELDEGSSVLTSRESQQLLENLLEFHRWKV